MKKFFSSAAFRFIWSAALALILFFICPPCFSKTILGIILAVLVLLVNTSNYISKVPAITHVARILVGGLFVFSGFIKANDPLGFSYKLKEYFEVFQNDSGMAFFGWFAHIALPLAVIICASEIILGVLLLLGIKRDLTLWLLFAQITFFTFLTFYSACFNKVTSCGCFGDFLPLKPWESFWKDIVLMILITLLFAGKTNINPVFHTLVGQALVIIGLVFSIGFPVYAYRNLPPLDFRAYAPGMNIKENMRFPDSYAPAVYETGSIYENLKTGAKEQFNSKNYPWQDTLNWKWFATENVVVKDAVNPPKISDFKFMGIVGDGYGHASVKNFALNPPLEKDFFGNELLKVEDDANKKDSAYWTKNRAIPLTEEEKKDYSKKDSIEKITSSPAYKDSVDKVRNRLRFSNLFFGYTYHSSKNEITITSPGIVTSGVQYNTVEGVNLIYNFTINKDYEDQRIKRFNGKVRYGFSNALWGGELGYNYFYNPKKFSRYGFKIKSIVEQFNAAEPITPIINSFYTLFLNENHMKLFKESAVEGSYFSELKNGVFFNAVLKYAQRDPLKNSADYLWVDDKSKLFTSNDPQRPGSDDSAFVSNRAFTTEFSFSFRFKQKYVTRPNQKVIMGSKYPRLNISYRKAIPTLETHTDYDLMSLMIYDDVSLGLLGKLGYRLRGGGFLNNKNLQFMDYKHFLGNQTIFNTNDYLNSYRLLPYYEYSADQWYTEAHAEHHFNGFLFNAIPLIKKLKAQEVVGAHFLFNNKLEQYYEINFALENIFGLVRIDYVLAYGLNNKVRSGFTIGINSRL